MSSEILVHESPEDVLAERVRDASVTALAEDRRFSIALPGGSVATKGFPKLGSIGIDWSHVDVLWGDERAVPPSDPESNFGLAQRLLLDAVRLPAERIHRMPAERTDLARAAVDYEAELRSVVRDRGIDVAILGVGPDGHVCSLFPGHALLDERERWVAAIEDSPKPPPRRLTLTLPALEAARSVIVVALGEAKAAVVRASVEDARSKLPLALVLQRTRATLLLDPAAASALSPR